MSLRRQSYEIKFVLTKTKLVLNALMVCSSIQLKQYSGLILNEETQGRQIQD